MDYNLAPIVFYPSLSSPLAKVQNSTHITPIDATQKSGITLLTQQFIDLASSLFAVPIEPIPVRFDLKGRSAGMFRIKNGDKEIRFNPWIFAMHPEQNCHDTVPHEVAHYVVYELFGRRGIRPHGREWQNVMIAFGREPKTTCDQPLDFQSGLIPVRKTTHYAYRCDCRDHKVGTIRHNRTLRGQQYICRQCGSALRPIATNCL